MYLITDTTDRKYLGMQISGAMMVVGLSITFPDGFVFEIVECKLVSVAQCILSNSNYVIELTRMGE